MNLFLQFTLKKKCCFIDSFSYVTVLARRQNKGKTEGGQYKPASLSAIHIHNLLLKESCSCVVGCQNRWSKGSKLKLYPILPDNKNDNTCGYSKMLAFATHTSYQGRLNKLLSLDGMDYGLVMCLKISHAWPPNQKLDNMLANFVSRTTSSW